MQAFKRLNHVNYVTSILHNQAVADPISGFYE